VASNLQAQGKYAEAQPLFEKTLAIWHQVLGEAHPDTALSYNNVASNLQAQGKYSEAQPLAEKALAICRQMLGEAHTDTATSYNCVAFNLNAQGKTREAIQMWQAACRASDSARLQVAGSGFDRARYKAEFLFPHQALAVALAGLDEPSQAWSY